MSTESKIPAIHEIFLNINRDKLCCCIFWAIVFAIVIRLILSAFKTLAVRGGELDREVEGSKWKNKKHLFWYIFWSNAKDIKINDYWLSFIIGFSELLIYPILMIQDIWTPIGAWIAIKVAVTWGNWQKSRTIYNRFLVGNILSIIGSCIIALLCFKSKL